MTDPQTELERELVKTRADLQAARDDFLVTVESLQQRLDKARARIAELEVELWNRENSNP